MRSWARWPDAVALALIVTIVSPSGKRTLRFANSQDDITLTAGTSTWILAGGVWNDSGFWDDTALWIDTPIDLGQTFTWKSEPGCLPTAIAYASDGTVTNLEVTLSAYEDGQLKPKDVILGVFDGGAMIVELVDPTSPQSGTMVLLTGYVGAPKLNRDGTATFELRSELTRARSIVTETFGPNCRADYGDDRCKRPVRPADLKRSQHYVKAFSTGGTLDYNAVNDAWARVRVGNADNPSDYANLVLECTTEGTTAPVSPDYSGISVGSVINDGTCVFTARESLCRYAKISSIVDGHSILLDRLPESGASADGYYTLGTIILRSGDNEDVSFPLSNWVAAGNQASFFLDISEIIVGGEWIEIMRGCDKTKATCHDRDDNNINSRSEEFVPGRDLLLTSIPSSDPTDASMSSNRTS